MRYLKLVFTLFLFGLMYAFARYLTKLWQTPYNATLEVLMFAVAFWQFALIVMNGKVTTPILRELPFSRSGLYCTVLADCLSMFNMILGLYLVTLWAQKDTAPSPQLSYLMLGFSIFILICAILFWIRPKVPAETMAVVYNKIYLPRERLPVYLIFWEKIMFFSENQRLEVPDFWVAVTTKEGGIRLDVRTSVGISFAGGQDRYCNPREIYLMGQQKILDLIRGKGSLNLTLGEVIDSICSAQLTFKVGEVTATWTGQDAEITIPSKAQAAY